MTEQSLLSAKIDLFNLVANLALKDYENTKKKMGKKFKGYSLSFETEIAREMYSEVYGKTADQIVITQEELIKGYLLSFRINRTDLLADCGGLDYYAEQLEVLAKNQ